MPLSTTVADDLLNTWGSTYATYMSLHSAYSASGGNELSGGSYARVAVTWGSASSNSIALSGTPYNLNAPSSTTVEFIGFWNASSSGTFAGMVPAGNASAYTFSAPSATSTLLAPGSGYSSAQTVVLFNTGGSTLPSGLTAGTIYYVKSPSSDSFQLSASSGGTAITISADGSGYVQAITAESFGSAGTFTVTSGSWSMV